MAARYATDADLLSRVPGASSMSSTQRYDALSDAEAMIDLRSFAEKALRAHVCLAAHYLALIPGTSIGGSGAPISSRSGGEASVSYAVGSASSESQHSSTAWGRMFDEIAASICHMPEYSP